MIGALVPIIFDPSLGEWSWRAHHGPISAEVSEDGTVRIPPWLKRNVVFLYVDVNGEQVPNGTAFLVYAQVGEQHFPYLVTARHVVTGLPFPPNVRVEQPEALGGGLAFTGTGPWLGHPDPAVDVAISPFGDVSVRLSQLSAMDFTASRFTAERLAERGHVLSEGDEVFFVGLFNLAPGRTRNQPAFRFGRISLIPDEPLLVKVGENVLYTDKAFIVECQAYPGFSGSPLFLHLPQEITPQGEGVAHIKEEAFVLLGLVSGYHKDTDNLEFEGVRRFTHYGLSVAVGVDAIADLIDHPDLVARRERFAAERTAARAAKAAAEPAVEGHALPPIDRAPRVNRAMKRSRKQSKRGR